jgi:hypothetical protein
MDGMFIAICSPLKFPLMAGIINPFTFISYNDARAITCNIVGD